MLPLYESQKREIIVEWKKSVHLPPHLHEEIELVYVTNGTVELGVGKELFHMEKGDFAIIFPNVIHHCQVFSKGVNKAMYIGIKPALVPVYVDKLQKYSPKYPIIHSSLLKKEISDSIYALANMKEINLVLVQAYVQIILAHVFSEMELIEKDAIGGNDIVYNVVEYVAQNFRKNFTLEKMAKDLCTSKFVLSRIFAKTFHCNFNAYVNGVRLSYVAALLQDTNEPITNLCFDCGFESQRTFNRVFRERYKMTPREYRNNALAKNLNLEKQTEDEAG